MKMLNLARVLLATFLILSLSINTTVRAQTNQTKTVKQYYDEFYTAQNGFMPVSQAVKQFESMYQKKVELPKQIPFPILMQKAELIDSPNQKGTALKVHFLGERSGNKLDVFVVDNDPPEKPTVSDEVISLRDGTKAVFRNRRHFYFLEFEKKNGLRYSLVIGKSAHIQIDAEVMRNIANSMTNN